MQTSLNFQLATDRKDDDLGENLWGIYDHDKRQTDFLDAFQQTYSVLEIEYFCTADDAKGKTVTRLIPIANLKKLKGTWIANEDQT